MFSLIFLLSLLMATTTKKSNNKKRKNTLTIARQSSKQQDTLDSQNEWISERVNYKKFHIVLSISDICKGYDFPTKHREAIIKKAKEQGIDYIVLHRIDRLARNLVEGIKLLDELNAINPITIVSSEGILNYNNTSDWFIVRFLLLLAEHEQNQRMDRVGLKIISMLHLGLYPRKTTPFGYKQDINKKLVKLYWCDRIITLIFNTFIKVGDFSSTARFVKKHSEILNDKKLQKILESIDGNKIKRIISDRIYIGYLQWSGTIIGKGDKNEPHDDIKVIDKCIFDKAQLIKNDIEERYKRGNTCITEKLANEYGLDPVLKVRNYKPICEKCGGILTCNNGTEPKKDRRFTQRRLFCRPCEKYYRYPKCSEIKRIEKLVAETCPICKKNIFTLIKYVGYMWKLRCNSCEYEIILHNFVDNKKNNESKPVEKLLRNKKRKFFKNQTTLF
jgi:DNA invertase Pin-like site-specific DNA recombinase